MKIINTIVLLLTIVSLPSEVALANGRTIYLIRHAEKLVDGTLDPSLTTQGRLRANNLVELLKDANIMKIYSTNYNRTKETVAPLAVAIAVKISFYNPAELSKFSTQVKAEVGNILIVGHSNTTPDLVTLLGGDAGEYINDTEYDRLYSITYRKNKVTSKLIRYEP